jgi:glycosyltransferase involved in cell wall biosynthesis
MEMNMSQKNKIETGRILAIIPAFNESARIAAVIEGALTHLPVLVVDDGSTDDTAAVAGKFGATVIRQSPNQGKGAALKMGFREALDSGYEAVITLDADGQHDPAEIPRFIQAYSAGGADLIIGERDFEEMPPIRSLANWLGGKTFSWALGQPIPDNQSGYRLINRRLMLDLLAGEEAGFEFEMEMIVTCVRHGYKLDWVPISTIYAGESSHIDPVHHLSNFFRVIRKTRRESRL